MKLQLQIYWACTKENENALCCTGYNSSGKQAQDVSVSNIVRELCDERFKWFQSLRRVTLGSSSSLQPIGVSCFFFASVEHVHIMDSARELCERRLKWCQRLHCLIFSSFSSLEWIGPH